MDNDGKSTSSLSFLSQDNYSPILFANKSHADTSYGPTTGETPVKWQTGHKEFHFNSNSTPSKPTTSKIADAHEDPARKLLRKRRMVRNTLSGAKPRLRSNLHEFTTKLDLLDDQKLTSLPIPPPMEELHRKVPANPTNEVQIRIHADNRRFSVDPRHRNRDIDEDDDGCGHQPIVLVEDYIPEDPRRLKFAKNKVSISDLKSKVMKNKSSRLPIKLKMNRTLSTTSSLTLSPHIKDDDSFANMAMIDEDPVFSEIDHHSTKTDKTMVTDIEHLLGDVIKQNEEDDQYLQTLNLGHKIKGCVICEKPLYEISSLIEGRHFTEIVCSSCTFKYEETAKLLEDYEFDTSTDSINDSHNLSIKSDDLLEEPEQIDVVSVAPQKLKTNQFSPHLINRLHLQLQQHAYTDHNNTTVDSKTMIWFIEAKRKLRWKWRVNGLLPQFLAGKRNM
ncbi:LANO_0B07822g1_1 [Lachancea nothofagi CBS 11611]|uniref:LANO_0B07822g1_1 n=1 Tax=Lachancea nothofagi CBS 11611 TaxID=1266666 RepID=A0A1G4J089_9SACH|nr:LANO_0B07822g1_1 [Lachancea nothofagi CBS 11611]